MCWVCPSEEGGGTKQCKTHMCLSKEAIVGGLTQILVAQRVTALHKPHTALHGAAPATVQKQNDRDNERPDVFPKKKNIWEHMATRCVPAQFVVHGSGLQELQTTAWEHIGMHGAHMRSAWRLSQSHHVRRKSHMDCKCDSREHNAVPCVPKSGKQD